MAAYSPRVVDAGLRALLLQGARSHMLHEWQVAPALWNQVRRAVDGAEQPGQFLLTGSVVPAEDASCHTGAVSLRDLFAVATPSVLGPSLSLQDLRALIGRGGWPALQSRSLQAAGRAARDYLEQVRQVDISRVGERRLDPVRVGAVLRALGRLTATEAKLSTLAADTAARVAPWMSAP
jgi:hypothetical protein